VTRPRRATGAVYVAVALLALAAAWHALRVDADWPPAPAAVRAAWQPSDARLLDRHGALLQVRRVDPVLRRLPWTPLDQIAPALVRAVLLSEDQRFYEHGGVDGWALGAGVRDGLMHGRRRGASTITMQLAALLRPALAGGRGGRSVATKLRQMVAARAIEARWSKAEILEAYLNLASFRGELVGVAAASQGLLGKEPHGVDAAEALVLASLLRAPNADPARVAERASLLAERAGRFAGTRGEAASETSPRRGEPAGEASTPRGDLAAPDLARARAIAVLRQPPPPRATTALAPHLAARLLPRGAPGDVHTTLDAEIQRVAIDALRDQLLGLGGRNVRDGAVLVVENATGDVLAWVGSSGDLSAAPQVDGVRARRQAGSTLKPFLYALAFEDRLQTPSSHIEDSPLDVATPTGVYRPENYDHLFRGLVTARVALASSLNVPAVRTVQQVGVERFVERLAALGFDALRQPDYYGESVALGSADVTLQELVNAYRTLARGGVASALRLRADDPHGPDTPVGTPATAFQVARILSDRASRSATFGLESPLATPVWTAVKTGTSKDMRDNWCIGFSSDYTVGVWVGNFSGEPMWQVSGVDGAAPAWLEIVQALHRDRPSDPPPTPDGVVWRDGEAYVAGTEPTGSSGAPTAQPRRIRAPANGTFVALDPDIPRARQRVFLESDPPDATLQWRLDGTPAGAAGTLAMWEPVRGRHRLELVDSAGATVDAIRFEVR
jgi:penicillin-binding protein 1C